MNSIEDQVEEALKDEALLVINPLILNRLQEAQVRLYFGGTPVGVVYYARFEGTDKGYVGRAVDLTKRIYAHSYNLKHDVGACRAFCNAMKKYGFPHFSVIDLGWGPKELGEKEVFWIKALGTFVDTGGGYNLIDYTQEPYIVSEETRERMSVGKRGENGGRTLLTEPEVIEIRERYAKEERAQVLAKEYGVHVQAIYALVTGRSWRHIGGPRTHKPEVKKEQKVTDAQVQEIRERYARGEAAGDLAEEFQVVKVTIQAICNGNLRKMAPGPITSHRELHGYNREEVVDMRRRSKRGESQTSIAKRYGCSNRVVRGIAQGHTYKDFPGPISEPTGNHSSLEEVIEIRERYAGGEEIAKIAESFNVDPSTVVRTATGKVYKNLPGPISKLRNSY